MVADVDGERGPRASLGAHRPRRLRDISHLYLSTGREPVTVQRRMLRLGLVSQAQGLVKSDVCANLALQLTRLGQRTLVLDLDPELPNAGFLLGLEPQAYAAHLRAAAPRLERALLGLRVVEGLAGRPLLEPAPGLREEIDASDCVLVNFPDLQAGAASLLPRLGGWLGQGRETTMAQAASQSRMFGAWLETARRQGGTPVASPGPPLDALILVHAAAAEDAVGARFRSLLSWLGPGRVHLLLWGQGGMGGEPQPWARIQPYTPCGRGPLSAMLPEHPAAQTYQGLAQALLAGLSSRGASRA